MLEAVVDQLPAGVILAEAPSGRLILGNREVERIFRQSFQPASAAESYERWILMRPDGTPLPTDERPLRRALRGETVTQDEVAIQRGDGTQGLLSVNASPVLDEAGSIIAAVATFTDVTLQKQLEQELRASEERFRTLVEQSPLSIQVLAPDGTTLQVNRAWEELWSLTLAQLQQVGYNVLQDPQLEQRGILPYLRRGFAGEATRIPPILYQQHETLPQAASPDDSGRWVRAVIYPVRNLAGTIERLVLIHEDFTETKRLEEALAQRVKELAAADRRKDEFLAMLGHELRNPLSAVANALQVMEIAPPGSPAFQRSFAVARRQLAHQQRIVDDLLDVNRISRGRIQLYSEQLDLAALVRDAVEDRRDSIQAVGLELSEDIPPSPVQVTGDRTRLLQVVDNLLDNARKFTPPGGRIHVRLLFDPAVREARLVVADTGVGLDPDLREYLFEAFAQAEHSLERSRGGLGLGLYLARSLVELHGGRLIAESGGPGQGTEFSVYLPLAGSN